MLTLKCYSITFDRSNRIIDVILRGSRRIHPDNLKIHWHTAESVNIIEWQKYKNSSLVFSGEVCL